MKIKQIKPPVLALLVLMLFTACTANIHEFHSPLSPAEHFSDSGPAALKNKWWLAFNDNDLNQLIAQALTQNFSLRVAYDRLAQARAIAKKSSAELIPQLNGSFTASHTISETKVGRNSIDDFSAGFAASYELDLWGRIRSAMNAAELDQRAAQQDINIAAISLSAEISSTWYKLIDQRQQARLLDSQIMINQDNVDILLTRFNLGQARAADIFQQKQLLQATIGDKATVIAQIKSYEYQLASLLGKPVNTLRLTNKSSFPPLPDKPDTGLSSELIQRRPDIIKAYLKVQAADQRIASAIAERFPKISLSASINSNAPELQNLFNNWLATLAGNLVLPIIDGNRRIAEVERNKAVFSESVNQYATAILTSLEEVETALINEKQQLHLIDSLDQQLAYSRLAYDQIHLRYRYGGMDFLRVLSARLSVQTLERSRIRAERELIDYRIKLYKALAGGWPLSPPTLHSPDTVKIEHS